MTVVSLTKLLVESIPSAAWPILAASGGAIVFIALWMEHGKEKEKFSNLKHFRRQLLKAKWGWKLLMIGIGFEVVVAFALAWRDDIDINAAQNAWRIQRIYALEATAKVLVRPLEPVSDFESLPKAGIFMVNPSVFSPPTNSMPDNSGFFLYLGRAKTLAKGEYDAKFAQIKDDEARRSVAIEGNGTNQWLRFDIHFGGRHENFFRNKSGNSWDFFNDSLTPDDLDAIDLVLPIRCEVVWGEVEMNIDNGLTNRTFPIPKQTTFVHAATSFATNGDFVPIDFSPKIRAEQAKENGGK